MPSLVIPRSGLPLEVGMKSNLPPNGIIGLTLNDDVIEDMIKCVRSGEAIQLSLGLDTTISYGPSSHHLTSSADPFSYDIYQNSTPSTTSPNNTESTMSSQPFRGPRKAFASLAFMGPVNTNLKIIKEKVDSNGRPIKQRTGGKTLPMPSTARDAPTSKGSTQGTDDALQTLKNTLAIENAKKTANTTQLVRNSSALPPPVQKRGPAVSVKYGSNSFATTKKSLGKGTIRSLPPSPALAGISSPSLAPTSIPASQQQAEKTKAIRNPIIHRLALGPAAEDELMKLRTSIATESEFKMAIEKVADLENGKWKIHPRFLKDLDVWKYDYEDDSERQTAIDNAIRAYDKMRLNPSEPQWQMLLPVAERNKGKCLSKLQAKIATSGNLAPKPKTKPADDSGRDSADEDTDVFGEKRTKSAKSESMVRSTSQNSATKSKAAKEREAQDKRLSGKTTAKPAPKKAPPKKAPKKAPPKKQAKETFKSSQFVNDSDEEDSYTVDTKPTPKIASSAKKTQPVEQNAKKASVKRKSDDMDAMDDSIIVASKKPKTTQNSSASSMSGSSSSHQRISESSQSSHNVASIQRSITKARAKMNTSPQKSSPLASSPPTNASDMEDIDHSTSVSPSTDSTRSLKRKIIGSGLAESPKKKRNTATEAEMRSVYDKSQFRHIPSQCLDASARFQVVYGEYHKLYMELQADPTRLAKEHRKLMDMHDMLASMKREIIEAARDKSEDR